MSKLHVWETAVRNIRQRWPEEMKSYSDAAIARMYEDFYFSGDAGHNDDKLPERFSRLPHYEKQGD